MVTMIKARLANSNDSSLDALIIDVANVVQDALEQEPELPWFLEKDTNAAGENMSTVASTETVALPSDFLREEEEKMEVLFVQDTTQDDTWTGLTRDDYTSIKQKITGSGQPSYYDIYGSNIYLRKIPDAVYTLRLLYKYSDDAIVTGTTENQWMKYASDWIMAETGFRMASTYVVMPAIAQQFSFEMARARTRVSNDTIARREAGQMRQMGED